MTAYPVYCEDCIHWQDNDCQHPDNQHEGDFPDTSRDEFCEWFDGDDE